MDRNNRDFLSVNEERPGDLPTESIENSFKPAKHRKSRTSWVGMLIFITVVIVVGISICPPNYMKIDPGRQALNDTPYAVVLNSGADAKSTNIVAIQDELLEYE